MFDVEQLVKNQREMVKQWEEYSPLDTSWVLAENTPRLLYFDDFVRKVFTDFPKIERVEYLTMNNWAGEFICSGYHQTFSMMSRACKMCTHWEMPHGELVSPNLVFNYRTELVNMIERDLEILNKVGQDFIYCFAMEIPVYGISKVISPDPQENLFEPIVNYRMMTRFGKKVLHDVT